MRFFLSRYYYIRINSTYRVYLSNQNVPCSCEDNVSCSCEDNVFFFPNIMYFYTLF